MVIVKHFPVACSDLGGVKWLSYSTLICWDSCLKYSMCLYNITGQLLKTVSKESPEFHLGIKTVGYSHLSQLLVIGHFSSQCEVFNATNLTAITDIDCSVELDSKASSRPRITGIGDSAARAEVAFYYENDTGDYSVTAQLDSNFDLGIHKRPNSASRDQKCVSDIQFSHDGLVMMLLVWNVKLLALAVVLIHKTNIKCAAWSPNSVYLAIGTGSDRLYMWTLHGCIFVQIPDSELGVVSDLSWSPSYSCLSLSSKLSSCVVFLSDDGQIDTKAD